MLRIWLFRGGNAAILNLVIGPFGWRWVFVAGAAPAPLMLLLRVFVREPVRWVAVHQQRRAEVLGGARDSRLATLRAIFRPGMRTRTIVGVLIAMASLMAGNSTLPFLANWVHQLLPQAQQAAAGRITSELFMLYTAGGLAGYAAVIGLTDLLSRRSAYTVIILCEGAAILVAFTAIMSVTGLLWFAPVLGFFIVGGIGFFAAYFPELFPTAVRATGQGFCWNMARSIAALGPLVFGKLVGILGSVPAAGSLIPCVCVVGLVAIWFGPETKGQPLPD